MSALFLRWLLLGCFPVLLGVVHAGEFEDSFRKEVGAFLDTLSEEQQENCMLKVEDKERWKMVYPGGKRPGVRIGDLNDTQRAAFEKAMRLVLSDYGWQMANKVALQDGKQGLGKYWLTCFGDPRKEDDFAFRVAEHHLTIVHLEVVEGETKEFGPILLGSDPPELWKECEMDLIELWKTLDNPKALIKDRKGVASAAMSEGDGIAYAELNDEAKKKLKAVWERRLSIFTPSIKERIKKLHQAKGGWEQCRVAYYNEEPEKRCIDGGRWDFKCGMPGFLWDLETSRTHIHMSLWTK
ncbi:Protein of unknown function [Rubritalea squalenifaciens DSM 18772]|uniref:DUF3500 domain-containing protein n=1 Tax=Rubritalea squalenifaciens DSM 18772 TaxID=1123071 RepID=A0A1M6PTM5_9BACT|nr:DUF3500 domain-containing protein [Rubritalea squalenifaciens]SHK11303.1 Protein of unknown function [Rubritalea squalenifaciens DSM 18772]